MTAIEAAPAAPRTISEVAEQTGISAHALRYYERIGLLDVGRDSAGHRCYSAGDIRRVGFITRLRQTDMPIRKIQRYFALVDAGPQTKPDRLELLIRHRESVLARMGTLRSALDAIDFKIAFYGSATTAETNGQPDTRPDIKETS